MKVFLTGDRSFGPMYPGLLAVEMLRAVGRGDSIVTGDNRGCEEFVRELAKSTGIDVEVIETPRDVEGKRDWVGRAERVANVEDLREVVVTHGDPHASSMVPPLFHAFGDNDEMVRLVSAADLLV